MSLEDRDPNSTAMPMPELLALAARVGCQGVGLLLIVMGAMYAISVFSAVFELVKDPQGLESPVRTVSKAIDAEKLSFNVQGQAVSPGGTVAMILLLLWYVFLAWIPLAIVKTGGLLIYWTVRSAKKPDDEKKRDA
jgi:hypothetical protein